MKINPNLLYDSGNNSNGGWIKYSDGTMIIYQKISKSFTLRNWYERVYYSDIQLEDFIKEFISIPIVNITQENPQVWIASLSETTKKNIGKVRLTRQPLDSQTTWNTVFNIIAIGKYK